MPSERQNKKDVTVRVVSNFEDFARVMALRAAVYMTEQFCPYSEEFDGNDFSATHLISEIDGEPVGTMRIRYFAGWAKPERLAVLKGCRGAGVADEIVAFGKELCRRKGYTRLYGHAQKRLLSFWGRHGFKPMGKKEFVFSDHDYVEIECQLARHPNPVSMDDEMPMVTIRPEGRWDEPGVLDLSANRPASNPY